MSTDDSGPPCDWCGNYTHNGSSVCSANACMRQAEMCAEIVHLRALVPAAFREGLKNGRTGGNGYWDLSESKTKMSRS